MSKAKWEVSVSNWQVFASMFEHIRMVAEKSMIAACDDKDEWNYFEFILKLKNLEHFASDAAKRLNGYEREEVTEHAESQTD